MKATMAEGLEIGTQLPPLTVVEELDQIANAISQMEEATRSTAGQVEERAAASRQLAGQADELRDVVSSLRELV